jgi:DNA-directed RNA polymerase specialized sigma24 family protein
MGIWQALSLSGKKRAGGLHASLITRRLHGAPNAPAGPPKSAQARGWQYPKGLLFLCFVSQIVHHNRAECRTFVIRQGINSRGYGSGGYTCVGNMKTTHQLSGRQATSALADDQGGSEVLALHDITRNEPVIPVSPSAARKEVLDLLVQHLAELPTATKKILSLYYHDDFSVSEIAAYSNLSKQQICEILSHTRGSLRKLFTR